MTLPPETSTRFSPLRRASRGRRKLLLIAGPLLWFVALLVLAAVISRTSAVEYALLILVASFVAALLWLLWMRAARVRSERDW